MRVTLLPFGVCLNLGLLLFQKVHWISLWSGGAMPPLAGSWSQRGSGGVILPQQPIGGVFPREACWGRVYLGQGSCVRKSSRGPRSRCGTHLQGTHIHGPRQRATWPKLNSASNLILMREGTPAFHWVPRPVDKIPVWDRVSGPLTGIGGPFIEKSTGRILFSLFTQVLY